MRWKCSMALVLLWAWVATVDGAEMVTVVGNGVAGSADGPVDVARLHNPFGVVRGPDGALWFCEYDGHAVRRLDQAGIVTTVVGSGEAGYAGDGGSAIAARLNRPHEIRFDAAGSLFIADMRNHAIRRVDHESGTITTVAGTGEAGFSGDGGPAAEARLNQPHSIQFGPDGRLYVCDIGNHRIRAVDPTTGVIETIAGDGGRGRTPDGSEFSGVSLNGPRTLDFDRDGNIWLALREGNQVFKLDLSTGHIHHIAGTGEKGFGGNGGPARVATLSGPKGIAIAANGDVYLADTESHSIRMIDRSTGKLELIAGTGTKQDGPDGDPLMGGLARPHGIFIDADGSIYIGDSENHRIRAIRR